MSLVREKTGELKLYVINHRVLRTKMSPCLVHFPEDAANNLHSIEIYVVTKEGLRFTDRLADSRMTSRTIS